MKKVLLGSPVRQKKNILEQFLKGIDDADKEGFQLSYYFVDDNKEPDSSELLCEFKRTHENTVILKGDDVVPKKKDNSYVCDSDSHHWKSENIYRITCFKDGIIEYCIENGFDYLFLVDSDIVIDKRSLSRLVSLDVDIVSNVFWTQWHPGDSLSPQCFWMPDLYQQYNAFNVKLDPAEATRIRNDFFAKLKEPGTYKVDGLGACTLIKRRVLEKGVRFKEVPNLSIPGEDRHFCIRAGVLGFDLYMDTAHPAYHIFREEYLSRVDEFKRDGFKFDMCRTESADKKVQNEKTNGRSLPVRFVRRVKRSLTQKRKRAGR